LNFTNDFRKGHLEVDFNAESKINPGNLDEEVVGKSSTTLEH
jgi:hypothetical protein